MASWGRHDWPKKNEEMRIYQERNGSYLLICIPDDGRPVAHYDGIANICDDPNPSLGSVTIGRTYTYDKGCKRVQWSELPKKWQAAFRQWIDDKPESIRGFWLVGQQPKTKEATS